MGTRGPSAREEGDLALGVTQPLPVMGKETSRQAVAEEEARTAEVRTEARWIELRRDLSIRLAEAALAERMAVLNRQDAEWLGWVERDLGAVQSARPVSSAAVLRLNRDRLDAELASTNEWSRLRDFRAALNRLLGRPTESGFGPLELPAPIPEIRFAPGLVGIALNAEPRLRLARRESKEASARVVRTRRTARPDLSLAVDSRQYSGGGGVREATVTLNLTLPWANRSRYRKDLRREQALEAAAEMEVRDLEAEVSAEVHHWVTAINAAGREVRLVRERILPQIDASLEVARSQWTAGQTELRDLLELHRQRIEAEGRASRAAADQWIAISQLLLCCGLDDLDAFLALAEAVPPNPGSTQPVPTSKQP